MDINKMIKGIRITAVVLLAVVILAFAYGAWENYRFLKQFEFTSVSDEYDITVTGWILDYNNDIELQKQWQADVIEAQVRLEKLGVEFDEVSSAGR